MFSLRNCGWLVERFFFCFPEDVLGGQYVTSSSTQVMSWHLLFCSVAPVTMSWPQTLSLFLWTPVTMSWPSSGPDFYVIWPWKRPASGWGSFGESSIFVPWLVFNAFWVGSGVVPERPDSSGFISKPSSCASAPRMRFYVLLNSFDNLFVTLPSISSETWVM